MAGRGYKKYMKKETSKDYSLLQLFVISFFGMLLLFTVLIKSFSPSVDLSIGDYKQESNIDEPAISVDGRLSSIQEEDTGRNFTEIMKKAEADAEKEQAQMTEPLYSKDLQTEQKQEQQKPTEDTVYKVFIGSYTSADQAKVAKDIIQESGLGLTPMVKCIGSNNYTLQVGIFKNKASADTLLEQIKQNHLPGRIFQEN